MRINTAAQCRICKRGPYLLSALYAHMRKVHKCSEEEINETKVAIKKAIYEDELKCDVCGKSYFSETGLRKHKKQEHTDPSTSTDTIKRFSSCSVECPGCGATFHSNVQLAMHCHQAHSNEQVDFSIVRETFDSWSKFEEWLARKEKETYTKLVRRHKRKSSKGTILMFLCQHARHDTDNVDPMRKKKRNRKSKKVNKHCSCFAKVQQDRDGLVEVMACFGHYGHEVNSALLPLSKEDKMTIKSMILAGIPAKTIVSELRIGEWVAGLPAQKQPRICFVTVRDVGNIAARITDEERESFACSSNQNGSSLGSDSNGNQGTYPGATVAQVLQSVKTENLSKAVAAGPLDNEGASGAYDADDNFEDIKGMSYVFPTTSGEAQPTARKRSRLSDSPGDTADDSDEESSISDFFLNGDQNENDTDLADKLEAAYRLNKKLLTQAFETASGLMEGKRLDLLDQLNRELKFVLECFPTTH